MTQKQNKSVESRLPNVTNVRVVRMGSLRAQIAARDTSQFVVRNAGGGASTHSHEAKKRE